MDIEYIGTGETIRITEDFLNDSLGVHDWSKVKIIRGDDLMYRNRGKKDNDSWDFNLFARVGIKGKIDVLDAASQLKHCKVEDVSPTD